MVLVLATLPAPDPQARAAAAARQADGSFVLSDIGGGPRLIRMNRLPDGLQLKAVYLEGRDVIDAPRDFAAGQSIAGVTLVLTDQITELARAAAALPRARPAPAILT